MGYVFLSTSSKADIERMNGFKNMTSVTFIFLVKLNKLL